MDDRTHDESGHADPLIQYSYLGSEWAIEDENASDTWMSIRSGPFGAKAHGISAELDRCLFLLAAGASCAWGCHGGHHAVNNIVRRIHNYAIATLRLAWVGHYDEAFGMLRGAGEAINLLQLFCVENGALDVWRGASGKEIRESFSPHKVRSRIQNARKGEKPVVDEATYWKLCEMGVHVTPFSAYMTHHLDGSRHVGAAFSDYGFFVAINQLALILWPCSGFSGRLLELESAEKSKLTTAGNALESSAIPSLRATNYENWFNHGVSRKAARQLADMITSVPDDDDYVIEMVGADESGAVAIPEYPSFHYCRSTKTLTKAFVGLETTFSGVTDQAIQQLASQSDVPENLTAYGATVGNPEGVS